VEDLSGERTRDGLNPNFAPFQGQWQTDINELVRVTCKNPALILAGDLQE